RQIATADQRELIEYRRTACRYCHGRSYDYQRTRGELAKDRRAWESQQTRASKDNFDEAGGDGFNATRDPHPECPECFGEGVERVYVHDTRRLSASALCLYAGVKVTKDGIEVKMHDQRATLVDIARHLGMFEERVPDTETDDARIQTLRAQMDAMDTATVGVAA
ncbi:MAG: hypothetical protein H0X39_13015, partial [Actinobacteria bacterium]|nr:hypothetical protein [Actinomycetota bacterium]